MRFLSDPRLVSDKFDSKWYADQLRDLLGDRFDSICNVALWLIR